MTVFLITILFLCPHVFGHLNFNLTLVDGQQTPFDIMLTSPALSASFSAVDGNANSFIAQDSFFSFPGVILANSFGAATLSIAFSPALTSLSFLFAAFSSGDVTVQVSLQGSSVANLSFAPTLVSSYQTYEGTADITVGGSASFDLILISDVQAVNFATGTISGVEAPASAVGDPVFRGFHGQKFLVKGLPERIYNILSLPSLQLNTRFIPLNEGQAMNSTQQASVRKRQSRLIAALKDSGGGNSLPSTTSWSHDGLYMSETGVRVAGHRLLVKPGAYEAGFEQVELDGAELSILTEAVQLLDGSFILRSSSSVVVVTTNEISFTLVNSDHFLNIHSTTVNVLPANIDHVDGLMGQTASTSFKVERTAQFTRHLENDFLLPENENVWSTNFHHNRYVLTASASSG